MEQIIIPPDEEWTTYISKMWLLGSRISVDILGKEMDGSPDDLKRLQLIVDSKVVSVDNTQKLESLGIIFGMVFVNETPNYDWWVVEDALGKDACIRYKKTSLLVFPQTMLSKRIEDGEEVNVLRLYKELKSSLDRLENESRNS